MSPAVADSPTGVTTSTTAEAPLEHEVRRVRDELTHDLLSRRNPAGHWRGRLSSSALSTAVAAFALTYFDQARGHHEHRDWVENGLDWLAANANEDGGWGDTVRSATNLPTTLLAWAALKAPALRAGPSPADSAPRQEAIHRAEDWIRGQAGSLEPEALKRTVESLYGNDKTFSVPILTLAALSGVLGPEPEAWRGPPALPFELAAFPQSFFRFLGLPVVSYALPALIAVGQVQHHRNPSRNPLARGIRNACRAGTLRRLESILPSSGGFLEAIPLTAFVTLSLVGAELDEHPVTEKCLRFLRDSVRPDGAWPIDIDLATWVTTLSVQALGDSGRLADVPEAERLRIRTWLLSQQYKARHPFTGADPGGWAWTDLPGGVPDADDTAGALLALHHLAQHRPGSIDSEDRQAAEAAVCWLIDLQNRDGGIPTFCRGWTRLPFDSSAPDLSGHALRALKTWRPYLSQPTVRKLDRCVARILSYLKREQRPDGSWVPLWFGHEDAPERENKVFGTARVLRALTSPEHRPWAEPARQYLLDAQNADGGWGGGKGLQSSVEETALAVSALAEEHSGHPTLDRLEPRERQAINQGLQFLVTAWDSDRFQRPAPIGFYFANLWYFEQLYPHTFALSALGVKAESKR